MVEKLQLPDVTLVCVDCVRHFDARNAMLECLKHADFAAAKLITDCVMIHEGIEDVFINTIKSKEEYSRFIFKELSNHFETSHVMICQWDGFIVNPGAWTPEFLEYDYIGAPWWFNHDQNVGNGGFSMRSKRLQAVLAGFDFPDPHPEDAKICRDYRSCLETEHGLKFAPEPLAARFSWEHNGKYQHYTGSFGFHGSIKRVREELVNFK